MLAESPARNTYVCACGGGGGGDERWRMYRRTSAACMMTVCVQLAVVVAVAYVPIGCRPETVLNYWYCIGLLGPRWLEIANELGQILLIMRPSILAYRQGILLAIECLVTWNRPEMEPHDFGGPGRPPSPPHPRASPDNVITSYLMKVGLNDRMLQ
jgi:hypothetical protein